MKLKKLIASLENKTVYGDENIEITGLCCDHKTAKEGGVFFCIEGTRTDGHLFASQAEEKGTAVVVCSHVVENLNVTQVVVPDVREAMSLMAAEFYSRPADKLKIIGITGTNGKTTTCHIIRNILRFSGSKVGIIGTLGIFFANVQIAPELTTPDPIFLHKIFADMLRAGVEYVVMEVSAHAIALKKIEGIRFAVGAFTNCTQDHLDFFRTMEEYGRVKSQFMTEKYCDFTVFNTDDELGRRMFLNGQKKSLSYGIDGPSDVFAVNVKEEITGVSFVMNLLDNIYTVKCAMAGRFSVYNCLAAATCCAVLGVDFDDIIGGIKHTECVSGRIEMVGSEGGKVVFVDYAHTPDGLKNVLTALRPCAEGRLVCLFGCGGNRDKEKRHIMGEIAGEYADFCIITTDNPRYEEPCDIIAEIERGVREKTTSFISIQDRASAIKYALSYLQEGDVLLIAGKGAEEYQEILGVRHEFSDRIYVKQLLARGRGD